MVFNRLNIVFSCLLFIIIFNKAHAENIQSYRDAHNEICYEVKEFKVECGNFKLASTILSKKYRVVSTGADVMASFGAKTHPGDHPFLNRLAKKLGYVDSDSKSLANKSIFDWNGLHADIKSELVDRYSGIADNPEMKLVLSNYLNSCIRYWSNPNAQYDKRTQLPTLAEVSALCIADSGVLPRTH